MTKNLLFIPFVLFSIYLSAQNCLEIIAPHLQSDVGEQICIPIKSNHFNHIENLQFSFAWDKQILEYVNLTRIGLSAFDIEVTIPEEGGKLGFDCTLQNPEDAAVSLPDDATLFEICFNVISQESAISPLTITNNPTPITVASDCPPDTPDCELTCISTINGTVRVGDYNNDGVLRFQFGSVSLNNLPENTETEITIPVTVENFNNIVSMQYTMNWNPDILTFMDVDCFLPNCNNNFGNQNATAEGLLSFSWIDESLNGLTLPDGAAIYNLRFSISSTLNEASSITFINTPTGIEIVNAEEVLQPVIFTSGQITPTNALLSNLNFGEWNIINSPCQENVDQSGISLEMIGGTPPYQYQWAYSHEWNQIDNSFSNEEDLSNLSGGTYFLTVTDAVSDTLKAMVYLISPSAFTISLNNQISPDYACNSEGDGNIDIKVSPSNQSVSYQWSNGSTSQDISNLIAGDYEVTATLGNECTIIKQFTVPLLDELEHEINLPDCNTDQYGSVYFYSSNISYEDFQFSWSNGESSYYADSLEIGTQSVTITYPSGCTSVQTFEIYENLWLRGNTFCNQSPDIDTIITIIWSDGTPPYRFEWDNGDTLVSNTIRNDFAFESGNYNVTVTDSGDCQSITDFTLDCNLVYIDGQYAPCSNTIYRYDALSSFNADQYHWEATNGTIVNLSDTIPNGQNMPTVFIEWQNATNNTLMLIGENAEGVADTLIREIFISIPPTTTFDAINYCEFEDSLTISYSHNPNTSIIWQTSSNEFLSADTMVTIVNDSTFFPQLEARITYGNSCEYITPVTFNLPGTISIASSDMIICQGETVDFNISPLGSALEYIGWFPDSSLTCGNCLQTIASPEVNTTYLAEIKDETGCYFYGPIEIEVNECVWPGDTDTSRTTSHFDLLNIGLGFGHSGFVRPDATLEWSAQIAPDWMQQTPLSATNYKHIDSDGDGEITALDTLAIIQNWGLMHNFMPPTAEEFRQLESQMMVPMYVLPDTLIENESYELPIILGESAVPAQNVYGLAFSLTYDPDIIVPGSAKVDFSNSWLGTIDQDMISIQRDFHSQGRIDVAVTRIDGQNVSGDGAIGHFFITIEDDILLLEHEDLIRNGEDIPTLFKVENVRLISFMEEDIPVITPTTEAEIVSSTSTPLWKQQLQIFPNPTKDVLFISTKNISLERIELFNVSGHRILFQNGQTQDIKLNLATIPAGCFWLKIQSKEGVAVRKIIVQK